MAAVVHFRSGEVRMIEEWKPIEGFPAYEVSNAGRVKRVLKGRGQCIAGRKLTPAEATHGYLQVTLCQDGVKYNRRVHVLVAAAFIPNPKGLPEVNHEDGVKANCTAPNLTWSTHSDNIKHAIKTGLINEFNNLWLARKAHAK